MADVTNEFLAEMLPRIQADISDLKVDVREIRGRVGHLEVRFATLETRFADMETRFADAAVRMDRRDDTIERILRRLDVRDEAPSPSA